MICVAAVASSYFRVEMTGRGGERREWSGGWCWSGKMEIDSGEVVEVVSR